MAATVIVRGILAHFPKNCLIDLLAQYNMASYKNPDADESKSMGNNPMILSNTLIIRRGFPLENLIAVNSSL
jgi:hypothetical protein